ncbi:HEAT repeat domain-containing protein [Streptomyces exfoliatus]|uniref:HEAT repeat domain-containing protein n=1 Tax=Streptomyces exfoliatus TaxID=1905 RepID=UPI003C2EA70A
MRDLARRWHETGVEAELRRLTGSRGALVRPRVQDDEYYSVDEYALGARTATVLLVALGEHADPRADAALVSHAGHPDARLRWTVARGLSSWSEPPAVSDDVREALLVLMTDTDAVVRQSACRTGAEIRDRDLVFADAMAASLDDADCRVQLVAVYGLALHDDERCLNGAGRLPPAPPGTPHEHELDAVWRYERRRDGR